MTTEDTDTTARPDARGIWKRSHHLDRMTLRSLTAAFFQHPSVWVYLALAGVAALLAWVWPSTPARTGLAALAAVILYPLAWYVLHRWVLHSRWMFRSPLTAAVWKRIHYDHHQDPNRLDVLFGALYTTLPTVPLVTLPAGWMIGGFGGSAVALAIGLVITCAYEYVHCIEHLPFQPRSSMLARMKARHLAHHFHDETGNFGITNFAWDRMFGTLYERRARPRRSPTAFNLGYTDALAQRYPWSPRCRVATVRPSRPDRALLMGETPARLERKRKARANLRCLLMWTVGAAILMEVAALGYLSYHDMLKAHTVIAMSLGVIFSVLLGAGLMALTFFSSSSGHDDLASGRGDSDDDPTP